MAPFDKLDTAISTIETLQNEVLQLQRTPDSEVLEFFNRADEMTVHLAGVVAAHTALPVLGIPMDNPPLGGLDALLATVQMPGGVPVGTLGAGGGGPVNAALLAARILALSDESLARRVNDHRSAQASNVRAKDARLQDKLGSSN